MAILRLIGVAIAALVLTVGAAAAAPGNATATTAKSGAEPAGIVVLDTTGFWRTFHTLKPPVAQLDGGLKPGLTGVKWYDSETDPAPADWTKTEFDDSSWARLPLRRTAATPYLAQVYVRGKFHVTDLAKVKGLKLWVDYIGGAVVYVNGKEIKRANLPAGKAEMAEAYPEEAFADAKGGLLDYRGNVSDPETLRRKALRRRKLEAVAIPASALKPGINVLAIEVVRAPYDKVVSNFKPMKEGRHPWDLPWGTCQIIGVQLAADSADGLVPNCARPSGLQVWNSDPLDSNFDLDFGDTCEPLLPIHLVGVKNGAYSGKVVVGSDKPIAGLKATASDLKNGSDTISASAVQIRYALPWGDQVQAGCGEETPGMDSWCGSGYPYAAYPATPLGLLAEAPLKDVPVRTKPGKGPAAPNPPAVVFGAVAPLWVTVKVPATAKPGLYKGEITITANGEKPVKALVEIKVIDWTLPDTQNYRVWSEFMESPETLALEYKLEPWSEAHWAMIAKSFKYFGETSSRTVYVPLICHTNLGNEQSMVRWIKKADGKYDYDFSIMDKYLDTATKNMGKPKLVCFVTWEIYLLTKEIETLVGPDGVGARARQDYAGKGPPVTMLDPATGKLANANVPRLTDVGSMAIWKSLFDQLRAHLKARGLENTAAIGFLSDAVPSQDEYKFLNEATGGLPWLSHSHHGTHASAPYKTAYYTHVFSADYPHDTSKLGWLKAEPGRALYLRGAHNDLIPAFLRNFPEISIMAMERGIGRLGGDYWPAVKDKKGVRVGNTANLYPESNWRNLELLTYYLAPGPDGPLATSRFEALREGLQDSEVRIYLEAALNDKALRAKLGEELATRIQQTLDERLRYIWKGNSNYQMTYAYGWGYPTPVGCSNVSGHSWLLSTRPQDRSEKFYALAAEVAKRLGSG